MGTISSLLLSFVSTFRTASKVFFVIRHKENLQFETVKENELPDNRHEHILKDEMIILKNYTSKKKYPKKLRRVVVWDEKIKM